MSNFARPIPLLICAVASVVSSIGFIMNWKMMLGLVPINTLIVNTYVWVSAALTTHFD